MSDPKKNKHFCSGFIAGLGLFISFTLVLAAEIHQWRDSDGKLHFGDRPPTNAQSQRISVKPNVYQTPSTETLDDDFSPTEKVVMYSATWCGYCNKARKYFVKNDIAFKEYDVESSRKGRRDYKRLGAKGVPVILVGKQRLNGFNVASFAALYKNPN